MVKPGAVTVYIRMIVGAPYLLGQYMTASYYYPLDLLEKLN